MEHGVLRVRRHLRPIFDQPSGWWSGSTYGSTAVGPTAAARSPGCRPGRISCSRAALSMNRRQDGFIHFTAILPALIHCSTVPPFVEADDPPRAPLQVRDDQADVT